MSVDSQITGNESVGSVPMSAEELDYLLDGHQIEDTAVVPILQGMKAEDHQRLLYFAARGCQYPPNLMKYLVGLVGGYHKLDPHRRQKGAISIVQTELDKAEAYMNFWVATDTAMPWLRWLGTERCYVWTLWHPASQLNIQQAAVDILDEELPPLRAAVLDPEVAKQLRLDEV